ncbi:MAG: NAD(+)/NADH kinase [Dehalococcoidia bacterium]|nr:NAD(+)/NADH kinase [Dehalococcoidia bacterium]
MAQRSVGFIYNQRAPEAVSLATKLADYCVGEYPTWQCDASDAHTVAAAMKETQLAVVLGGDGTILRVAHHAALNNVPILGVNLGRVGFMTELPPSEALKRLPSYLRGEAWTEERMMAQVSVLPRGEKTAATEQVFLSLNEAALGRTLVSRLVFVAVSVDGAHMATYAADAVIVATPTGSTGYTLSAGGAVLHPESKTLLIKPVAPQIALNAAVVVHESAVVRLTLGQDDQSSLNIDGFINMPLAPGDSLEVRGSEHVARFLRMGSRTYFYKMLFERLGFGKPISPDERRTMSDKS